jgi:hypothetical protein
LYFTINLKKWEYTKVPKNLEPSLKIKRLQKIYTFLTFYKRKNIFKNFDFDFARYIHTNKNKKGS